MKTILTALLLFLSPAFAHACPDLSGEYAFTEHPWNGSLEVKQVGCELISVRFFGGDYNRDFTIHHKTDERAYVGLYESDVLASDDTKSFTRAGYEGDRFVLHTYDGAQKDCGTRSSFTDFDCKLFEHTLGFDPVTQTFTWTQVAYWRSSNPTRYENSVFPLKKVR